MKTQLKQTAQKGFTLVELMIVLAIIGVLVGAAIPAYNGYITGSKIQTWEANCETASRYIRNEWNRYQLAGVTPSSIIEGLNGGPAGSELNLLADGTPLYVNAIPAKPGEIGIIDLASGDTIDLTNPQDITLHCKHPTSTAAASDSVTTLPVSEW